MDVQSIVYQLDKFQSLLPVEDIPLDGDHLVVFQKRLDCLIAFRKACKHMRKLDKMMGRLLTVKTLLLDDGQTMSILSMITDVQMRYQKEKMSFEAMKARLKGAIAEYEHSFEFYKSKAEGLNEELKLIFDHIAIPIPFPLLFLKIHAYNDAYAQYALLWEIMCEHDDIWDIGFDDDLERSEISMWVESYRGLLIQATVLKEALIPSGILDPKAPEFCFDQYRLEYMHYSNMLVDYQETMVEGVDHRPFPIREEQAAFVKLDASHQLEGSYILNMSGLPDLTDSANHDKKSPMCYNLRTVQEIREMIGNQFAQAIRQGATTIAIGDFGSNLNQIAQILREVVSLFTHGKFERILISNDELYDILVNRK